MNMKLFLKKSLFALSCVLLLSSCAESPKSVTENFLTTLANGQVEEAKSYCTESTAKFLDMASSLGGIKPQPNFKVECTRDSIVDNVAYVFYHEFKDGVAKEKEEKLVLYNIDGEWKVNMDAQK